MISKKKFFELCKMAEVPEFAWEPLYEFPTVKLMLINWTDEKLEEALRDCHLGALMDMPTQGIQ